MSFVIQTDGVNDVLKLASDIVLSGDFDVLFEYEYIVIGAGSGAKIISDGLTSSNRFNLNIVQSTNTIDARNYCTIEVNDVETRVVPENIPVTIRAYRNSNHSDQGDKNLGTIGARYSNSSPMDCQLKKVTVVTAGGTDAILDPDASDHSNTGQQPVVVDTLGSNNATGVGFPTDGSAWVDLGGGGISVTGDTAAFDFTALAGTVDLAGEILVTGSTASFDYSAISGAIDLTGQLLVTGQTANFDYSAINGGVEFTGEISVTGDTASFDYIALPGTIDLTGEIIVTGSTASFDYTGENGAIELGAVINVVGQTANFDVNGVNAEVSLTGEITIIGDTATFDYVAKSGIVVIGEGQKIGTVAAGFADSTIGVQYKQNTITVNFGE
tara:strand:- start:6066 stop:7217 length:1152 start_codon:yes stop_codon:yes gene_type:complete